ncbi:MAG: hypothetical protein R3D27_02875 [Hyphomicrobiaceae bacterium]
MSGHGLAGALIGAVLGLANYVVLGRLAGRVEMQETRRVLRLVAQIDLVVFPVVGFLIGTYLWQ